MDLRGRHVVIFGFGVEGISAADYFLAREARVEVRDLKEEREFDAALIARYKGKGVEFFFGPGGAIEMADLIVRSPGVPPRIPPLAAAAARGIKVTSATRIFFDECPGQIVGVTGTKGKGTTASLITDMLRRAGRDVHLVGNIGVPALTALPEITSDSIVVYEMSSFQLMDLKISPQVAVVLMVTQDHLDFHVDEEEYVDAKANIARFQKQEDVIIANNDYENSRNIAELSAGRKFWISRNKELESGCFIKEGKVVIKNGGNERAIIEVSLVALHGEHNLENICAASMAANVLGVADEHIAETARSFEGLPHRLRLAGEKSGTLYFDDSFSTTPESAIAAIRAFKEPKVVILGGAHKGADFSRLAEEIALNTSIKAVIGIGEEWARIHAALSKHEVLNTKRIHIIENCQNMEEVIRAAAEVAESGDVVLLSPGCASFGMFRDYKDRGDQFMRAVGKL